MRLRLLHTPPLDGATNMAVDEALLARARRTGDVTVRAYTWARPTLSFGRHQTALGVYDPTRTAELGVDVVRRPTGGRAVLHARELTYSVTAPITLLGDAGSLAATHARITEMVADAIGALGVAVARAERHGRARRPDGTPCFDAPAAGELVAAPGAAVGDARKLVGSAQWRDDGALLEHGSILIEDDQALLACCTVSPRAPGVAPATLGALLGRTPAVDEVADAVLDAARRFGAGLALDVDASAAPPEDAWADDAALRAEVARLLPRYLDPSWTWRR